MVALGAFMTCIAVGAMFSLAVFLRPITESTGWSTTAVSGAMTLNFLAMGAAGFGWGALSDRIGPRPWCWPGRSCSAWPVPREPCAERPRLPAFVRPAGRRRGRQLLLADDRGRDGLDQRRRGLAVALVSVGVGVAPMTMSPFAAWLITQMDWRAAQMVIAVLVWATLVPARCSCADLRWCPLSNKAFRSNRN
jgi:MFS family permease